MRLFIKKYKLLLWLACLLVCGFLATSVVSYLTSRDAIRHGISDQALPLTGDNIYSEIQKDLLRPIFISSLMANDTFVRDWVLGGERDTDQIVRYLKAIKDKYGMITSFLVSDQTLRYYYAGGMLKDVRENEPRDTWFFRVRGMKAPYEINVDPDMANRDAMTVFVNYRLQDEHGKFIGATGVGLTLDTIGGLIESYQTRFQRRIFFVDRTGAIVLAGKSMQHQLGSIHKQAGRASIAGQILNNRTEPTQLEYRRDASNVLVNSRFIPELNWYLVVEQDESSEVAQIQKVFFVNLAISAVITLLVLGIALFAVNRYQRRLERMAATDSLTGLLNRQAFEFVNQQSMLTAERSGRPLSAILFDLDHFKQINDGHGHLAGDAVLQALALIMRRTVRESDVLCRWGGEEFLVLLPDCPLAQAIGVAEKLREAIAEHDFPIPDGAYRITASLGVAQCLPQESSESFFARADQALYRAKDAGRNRVEVSG